METTNLTAEKSLQVISEMIEKSRRDFERNSGNPMILWGSLVLFFSIAVGLITSWTGDPHWNYLWFGIPVLGYGIELIMRARRKNEPKAVNFLNSTIGKIWILYGIISVIFAVLFVLSGLPGLITPFIVLLLGFSTSLTGAIIKNIAIIAGGMLTAVGCTYLNLTAGIGTPVILGAAAIVSLIIPGLLINFKTRKCHA